MKTAQYKVDIYGFVRADYIFDSRQSAQAREYQLNLYPLDKKLDANGQDINASGASNFLSIVSRLGVKASGPEVWGAKTTATIEGDFFGNTDATIGLLRLRHAYANLSWENTNLTMGQTWYPSFIPEVFPGVANFNTGIMFNPFGWAPQIKVNQKLSDGLSLEMAAYKDRPFPAPTVGNTASNSPSFNSVLPTMHAKLQYKNSNFLMGAAAEYRSLKPVIESGGLASNETLNSTAFLAYLKYSNEKITAKAYGITGGNLYHLVMIGGFAGYNHPNNVETYKPIKTTAAWVDISSNNPKIAPGVFFGYTKNSGTEEGFKNLYTRGITDKRALDKVWRASARVDFKQNKFKVSPELEYTVATYGDTQPDATAGGHQTAVGNFRGMISATYTF